MDNLARDFRVRFGAATLYLQTLDSAVDVANAVQEQCQSLAEWVRSECRSKLSKETSTAMVAIVIDANAVWPALTKHHLVGVIMSNVSRRSESQNWTDKLLGIFTQQELDVFRARGNQNGGRDSLGDIMARLQSLAAKNLDESGKKLMTAMWIHFRNDGTIDRATAQLNFKHAYTKKMKHFKTDDYQSKLPDQFWNVPPFAAAYQFDAPVPMTGSDANAIAMIDGSMSCRGNTARNHNQQLAISTPGALPQQQMMVMMMNMMRQMVPTRNGQPQNADEVEFTFPDRQQAPGTPMRGRPMRCLESRTPLGSPSSSPPPLGSPLSSPPLGRPSSSLHLGRPSSSSSIECSAPLVPGPSPSAVIDEAKVVVEALRPHKTMGPWSHQGPFPTVFA